MKKIKTFCTADVCHEAHMRTVKECDKLCIQYDYIDESGEMQYTELAQPIFERFFEEIEEKWEKQGLINERNQK